MLVMIEKCIRIGKYHAIYRYAKANKKCMGDYDPSTELSYLMYWDVNNLYEWTISQNLPVYCFKWRNDKF